MAPLTGPTPRSPSEELRLRGSCRAAFMPGDHEPREDAGPWPRAPVLRSAPEGGDPHPGLGPTACHGHSPGEEVGAPEGPVGALDKGRETGSTRWGPSPTYLGVAAGAARLPPLAHSQDLHPETWLGLRARWGPHLPSLGSCPIHLRPPGLAHASLLLCIQVPWPQCTRGARAQVDAGAGGKRIMVMKPANTLSSDIGSGQVMEACCDLFPHL